MCEYNEIALKGCTPTPLAGYLKALGTFRSYSEQEDPESKARWHGGTFYIQGKLSIEQLSSFFLNRYRPTPVIAPWNGGSGFYPKDNQTALENISANTSQRFAPYRAAINSVKKILESMQLVGKPGEPQKTELLEICRGRLSDEALDWLDAAFVLTEDGAKYPPLLGTGGNDGRLDFSNNFMQRIVDVCAAEFGRAPNQSQNWLKGSLFGEVVNGLVKKAAIGQFFPSAAGGDNSASGFSSDSLSNPWDYILMIEGALLFAAAAVKRLGSERPGVPAYPFTVRQSGVGYGSAALSDRTASRAEMWLPLWNRPATYREIKAVFSEGRAQVSNRSAANGVDFARAVSGLGVEKGIESFERYGFLERNGRAYFAIPLGRFKVRRNPESDLLMEIDPWLEQFRRKAGGGNAPSSIQRALNTLEKSIFSLCRSGGKTKPIDLLLALGQCEKQLSSSLSWTKKNNVRPIPPLAPEWLDRTYDDSPEFRLAAALASLSTSYSTGSGSIFTVPFRNHLEPVTIHKTKNRKIALWIDSPTKTVISGNFNAVDLLNAVMARRLIMTGRTPEKTWKESFSIGALLSDITVFIQKQFNDKKFFDLLWAISLLGLPKNYSPPWKSEPGLTRPGAGYALPKLCYMGDKIENIQVPVLPVIHRKLVTGNALNATLTASRRLKASGFTPLVDKVDLKNDIALRTAAALIFPIAKLRQGSKRCPQAYLVRSILET